MSLWAQIEELKSANKRLGAEVDRLRGERLVAYLAMRGVTIPDGQEPEGAVAALWRAAQTIHDLFSDFEKTTREARALQAALVRFEVATEARATDAGGEGR
jgi:hypothetical protein